MQGEEFDELLDNLPWRVRNQVLEGGSGSSDGTQVSAWSDGRKVWKEQTNRLQRTIWWLLLPIVYTWAGVVAMIGIVFLIVPPVGIFLLMLAGYPGAIHVAYRVKKSTKISREDPREGAYGDAIQ